MIAHGDSDRSAVAPPKTGTDVVRRNPRRPGPVAPSQPASREAQRLAAAILEVFAGLRTPGDAAQALGIGVPRYYLLEQRALAGLVAACESRRKEQGRSLRRQVSVLEKEVARLKQDCARQQALVRAAQRSIGLAPPPTAKPAPKASGKAGTKTTGKKPRKRRPVVRALKAAAALRAAAAVEDMPASPSSDVSPEVLQPSTTVDLPTSAALAHSGSAAAGE